jgi:hypothetical protein
MDIKKATNLEITSVFQQLLELIFYPYNSLCSCLNKPIYASSIIQEKTCIVWARGLSKLELPCFCAGRPSAAYLAQR